MVSSLITFAFFQLYQRQYADQPKVEGYRAEARLVLLMKQTESQFNVNNITNSYARAQNLA
ncbi:hypothetical protein DL239_20760 [Sedimentitalea sp. CY04]|uniref:Uncharacterized protein n=1 Tax=Parasedimentitalea denitrificans TaxID=2211118 RepID=A0ABX0WCG6_9RHOB|nr:hypothetical protein [Sedimentitalea sp. CY04]